MPPLRRTVPPLRCHDDGCSLRLRVVPGSSRSKIAGRHGDALKVAVTAPPERGKANQDVVAVLAEALGLARRDLTITAGLASRDKTVFVRCTETDLRERLAAALS